MLDTTGQRIEARFGPGAAGLDQGAYRLHATSVWTGNGCPRACRDRAPDGHPASFHVYGLRLAGCRFGGIGQVFNGPAHPKRIALTFDDGPSSYTSQVVSILSDHHAFGTFFEVGQEVPGRSEVMQSAIAHGDELGDHSMHHTAYPSGADIAETARVIKAASGFRPCLFRPPYGATNSNEIRLAAEQRMSTIRWDVDPSDWSRPGSGAIYQRVVSAAHPGAIVIMHDGGGDRSETVAALPGIIDTLQGRGYQLVTVSKLLGQRMVYRLDH
jgi:peptidoglycan/xylan/chitin deacetylase (PgdA/CDA1 family)